VHGPAYAGGLGLVACCDIAIATREATFCLSEVRLGLVPAVVAPYVIAAIGERQARRYFLTAEKFGAPEAFRIGLIHDLVEEDELGPALNALVTLLFMGGPKAIAECKDWIAAVARSPTDEKLVAESARRIARLRASSEGREGISAFLEKRDSTWVAAAKGKAGSAKAGSAKAGRAGSAKPPVASAKAARTASAKAAPKAARKVTANAAPNAIPDAIPNAIPNAIQKAGAKAVRRPAVRRAR